MSLYFEDVLPDEPDEYAGERNDLERDRDTLTDLLAVASDARHHVGNLETEASSLVLNNIELSEDEASTELPSYVSSAAGLIGDAISAIEYLLSQANDRLTMLDESPEAALDETVDELEG